MYRYILPLMLAVSLAAAPSAHAGFGDGLIKGIGSAAGGGQKPAAPAPAGTAPAAPVPDALSAVKALTGTQETGAEELAVGRQIAGNLLGAAPLVRDDKLQRYVNLVGRWVADQGERPELQWHFGVLDTDDVNAFAVPGGYIFVTKGLYRLLDSEAQLAGVLAHEVGHVVRKHHYKAIQQSRVLDMGSRFLGQKVGQDNELAQKLIGSGAEIVARGLDKDAEYEADRMGVVLSARAGYDQYALPEVLQKMGHYAADNDSVKLLFKTHPHPDDRISHLDASMADRLDGVKGATLSDHFYRLRK
ncbi:MAG: M48 family metalloprotease [Nitrospirae bacterium]|nr:M48 family metalloprotease [Nitrospirota bacterium]